MYCGCGTCCGKATWCITVLLLLASAAGLAAGLYVTVPCAKTLTTCYKSPEAGTGGSSQCWNQFWQCTKAGKAGGLYFFLACAGAGCFLLSLLTCCSFCCQRAPGAAKKGKKQDQFMSSGATDAPGVADAPTATAADTATYSDQYSAYSGYPNTGKPSVAHV